MFFDPAPWQGSLQRPSRNFLFRRFVRPLDVWVFTRSNLTGAIASLTRSSDNSQAIPGFNILKHSLIKNNSFHNKYLHPACSVSRVSLRCLRNGYV